MRRRDEKLRRRSDKRMSTLGIFLSNGDTGLRDGVDDGDVGD